MVPVGKNPSQYLVCTPSGGLNDSLCVIESSRARCEQTGVSLVIDLSRSWMGEGFSEVFGFSSTNVTILSNPEAVAEFERRVDRSLADLPKGPAVKGGGGSLSLLNHLRISPLILEIHQKELREVGVPYDVIHVRNSDYKTDFKPFLRRVRRLTSSTRVCVITDSQEVSEFAQALFGQRLHVPRRLRPECNTPLHKLGDTGQTIGLRDVLQEAVLDLLLAIRAEEFFYTYVFQVGDPTRRTLSGFGQLITGLRDSPLLTSKLTNSPVSARSRRSTPVDTVRANLILMWRRVGYPLAKRILSLFPGQGV